MKQSDLRAQRPRTARRIGEGVKRAFHGEVEDNCEKGGYFVSVNWSRDA